MSVFRKLEKIKSEFNLRVEDNPFYVKGFLDDAQNYLNWKNVEEALNYLHFSTEKAAKVIEKTIRSAVSNLLNENENADVDQGSLKLKEAYVDGGPVMKRFRAASMGRASRLRRPTSHLTVVIKTEEKRI